MIVVGILVLVVSSVIRSLIFPSYNIVRNILLGNIHWWFHNEGFSSLIFITSNVSIYSYELLNSIIQHITVKRLRCGQWSPVFYMKTFWNNYNIIISFNRYSLCFWLNFVGILIFSSYYIYFTFTLLHHNIMLTYCTYHLGYKNNPKILFHELWLGGTYLQDYHYIFFFKQVIAPSFNELLCVLNILTIGMGF